MSTVPAAPTPRIEPAFKRALTFCRWSKFILWHQESFGYDHPNYDILKLAQSVCTSQNWHCAGARFYTGVPDLRDNPEKNAFWTAKLAAMGKQGVSVYSRSLRYRNKTVKLGGRKSISFLVGQEKGIDVRIALDVIGSAIRNEYDVAIIFSQDQDLSEVADEIRVIARQQRRWIRMACAYPNSLAESARINGTQWIKIDRATYDACIDPKEYRPPKPPKP